MFKDKDFSIHQEIKILADLGFLAIKKEYQKAEIPHKKSKNSSLSDIQNDENKNKPQKESVSNISIETLKFLESVAQNIEESVRNMMKIGTVSPLY